jgi:hypothetical protein
MQQETLVDGGVPPLLQSRQEAITDALTPTRGKRLLLQIHPFMAA